MGLRSKLLRGSLVLTMGQGIGYACSFLRNMILARVLTQADFGVAALCSLTVAMFELTSKMAIGRLIVQDREGGCPRFVATAHFVQFLAALLSSLLIVATAGPLATFFGLQTQVGMFRTLALLPVFAGLQHLDVSRFTREFHFTPAAACEIIPQVIITLAAWPLAIWLKDFRTVVA